MQSPLRGSGTTPLHKAVSSLPTHQDRGNFHDPDVLQNGLRVKSAVGVYSVATDLGVVELAGDGSGVDHVIPGPGVSSFAPL